MAIMEPDFTRYDNPRRAEAIWNAYSKDFKVTEEYLGTQKFEWRLKDIITKSKTAWDLDVSLERLTRDPSDSLINLMSKKTKIPNVDVNSDTGSGSWHNSLRASEED